MIRKLTTLGMVIGLAFSGPFLANADDKDKGTGDPAPENLLGVYRITAGQMSGKTISEPDLKGFKVRITPETIVMVDKDDNIYVMKYRLNTDAKPWKVAMTMSGGPEGGRGDHGYGVMEMEQGGEVHVAYAVEGGTTPVAFETKEGAGQHMFVLQKIKDEKGR